MIKIYTDGASQGNPGKSGWAFISLEEDETVIEEGFGSVVHATNQQMEMQAVISGLESVPEGTDVEIYSDSAYVVNCFLSNWMVNWKKNGWKNAKKEPVKNKELWQKMDLLVSNRSVKFIKVKGHSGNKFNEIVDDLASAAASNA